MCSEVSTPHIGASDIGNCDGEVPGEVGYGGGGDVTLIEEELRTWRA